ncbi:uncharacterized protein DS421_8g242770 [Arachis hypogaea]|nr:uncharacterized protein DS421_8g242770 [Arachis hypogaea]
MRCKCMRVLGVFYFICSFLSFSLAFNFFNIIRYFTIFPVFTCFFQVLTSLQVNVSV